MYCTITSVYSFIQNRLYTTAAKNGGTGSLFTNPKNDKYHKVYLNNMDEDSFIGSRKGLQKILTTSDSAYIHTDYAIYRSPQYKKCQVEIIPWQRFKAHASIPLVKSSPLEPFMKEFIFSLYGTGLIRNLQRKWLAIEPECLDSELRPLSPQKVIVGFIWIIFGMLFALLTLMFEKMVFKCKKGSKSDITEEVESEVGNIVDELLKKKMLPDEQMISIIHNVLKKRE